MIFRMVYLVFVIVFLAFVIMFLVFAIMFASCVILYSVFGMLPFTAQLRALYYSLTTWLAEYNYY